MAMMHPARQAYVEDDEDDRQDTEMTVDLSNVPLDRDHYIPSASGVAPEKASAILAQFSRKRLAAQIAVPTDDARVRMRLRELGEPVTLFGEGPAERRDRLREILTQQAEAGEDAYMEDVEEDEGEAEGEYYTEGSRELQEARKNIARFSLPRAKHRIAFQKAEHSIPVRVHAKFRKTLKERLAGFEHFGSQIASSDRPLSGVRFSPSGELIAVGTYGGSVKLVSVPNLEEERTLRGHNEIVSGLCWFPGATLPSSNVPPNSINLASGGGEGSIHLWSLEMDTPITTLSGHEGRVAKIDFHPSGKYLASASYDMTWRLWDIETTTELLLQEGHSREVRTVSMNNDGSLLASGGFDSIGRVWDLRTGRMVMFLDSHIDHIHAIDWGVDGYRILSGSADGFIKCWDVRNVREAVSVGAHTNGVMDLKWFKGTDAPPDAELPPKDHRGEYSPKKAGTLVVSGGFDKTVKIFSADDWALCKTLTAHSQTVTGVDVTADAKWIASCGKDRTVKLWSREDMEAL